MSVEEYVPEIHNDLSDNELEEMEKEKTKLLAYQNDVIKKLYDDGGLQTENIIEIQYLIALIQYCPPKYEKNKKEIGKCLELIINLANQFLFLYNKQLEKKEEEEEED
tara:strand:+ start:56 stop:379 length:324 start_codon:yes stop_codon:yes gene_type:complete